MNLAAWRAKQAGEEFTLPSGLDVTLRRASLIDLAQRGAIPETLRPAVDDLTARGTGAQKLTVDELGEFTKVVDVIVAACIVGPEGLTVEELPWDDRMAIYQWANESSGKLAPFRSEQNGAVEIAFSSGELRPEAQRVSGARRR